MDNRIPLDKSGKWICEICDDPELKWKKNEKHKLIRHILKFDGGHWKAAFKVGKNAFGSNQEYLKIFETLEKRIEVRKFLEK